MADLDLLVHVELISALLLAYRQDSAPSDRLWEAVLAHRQRWEVFTERLFAEAPHGFLGIRQNYDALISDYRAALWSLPISKRT